MVRFVIALYILLVYACCGSAQNAVYDYDQLSKKTSRQLMTEGCEAFEDRLPAKALSCFGVIIDRYNMGRETDDMHEFIGALNNSGCVYKYFYYDYPEAYRRLSRAYELCEKADMDSILPVILVNLGDLLNDYNTIYKSAAMKRQADSLLNVCVDRALEKKNWELLTYAFYNLANNNSDIDLERYDAIFSDEIPHDTPLLEYVRLLYKGREQMQSGNYAEARDYFNRQLAAVNTRWQAPRDTIAAYVNIAQAYNLEKNYPKAAENLLKALQVTEAEDIRDLEAEIYRQLSDFYRLIDDTAAARQYRIGYLEKLEEMHNARLSNIAELNYLDQLNKEAAKAHELAYRERSNRIIIAVIALVLIVVVIFLLLLWRTNKKLHARVKSLFEKYREALERDDRSGNQAESKYSHSNLNDMQRAELVNRIRAVLADPDVICQQGFSSTQLAAMVGSNTTYVSQVINETYGVSFSILLGNCRVREACRRINDSNQFDNLTIEGIANSVGFKSRTALLNAFKREVGITPSEYIHIAAEEHRRTASVHSATDHQV